MNPDLWGDLSTQFSCAAAPSAGASTSKTHRSVDCDAFIPTPRRRIQKIQRREPQRAVMETKRLSSFVVAHQAGDSFCLWTFDDDHRQSMTKAAPTARHQTESYMRHQIGNPALASKQ